ncbi:hypothetical protein R3P38DRAFT_3536872, partial [Favolaschia claudopus]
LTALHIETRVVGHIWLNQQSHALLNSRKQGQWYAYLYKGLFPTLATFSSSLYYAPMLPDFLLVVATFFTSTTSPPPPPPHLRHRSQHFTGRRRQRRFSSFSLPSPIPRPRRLHRLLNLKSNVAEIPEALSETSSKFRLKFWASRERGVDLRCVDVHHSLELHSDVFKLLPGPPDASRVQNSKFDFWASAEQATYIQRVPGSERVGLELWASRERGVAFSCSKFDFSRSRDRHYSIPAPYYPCKR